MKQFKKDLNTIKDDIDPQVFSMLKASNTKEEAITIINDIISDDYSIELDWLRFTLTS